MARAVAMLAAATFLIAASGCLEIVDVLQPMEVRSGSVFEVAVACEAEFDRYERESEPAYGYLAVSLPEGFDVKAGSFRGAGDGRLHRWKDLGPWPFVDRPGYEWRVFGTRDYYRGRDLAGRALEVRLKLKAGEVPGDYLLRYQAGTAPAGASGPDISRLEFAPAKSAQRWITVR